MPNQQCRSTEGRYLVFWLYELYEKVKPVNNMVIKDIILFQMLSDLMVDCYILIVYSSY